jgi:hypothetical protein
MSRIAGFPTGLLDLVGSQNFGVNPKEMVESISPTIDLGQFFLASKLLVGFNPGTDIVANGANTAKTFSLTVPAGELWIVKALSLFLSTGVGEAMTATPILTVNAGTMSIGQGVTLAASQIRWNTATVTDLVVPAGARFGIWGSEVTGVPTAALTVLIARLRA